MKVNPLMSGPISMQQVSAAPQFVCRRMRNSKLWSCSRSEVLIRLEETRRPSTRHRSAHAAICRTPDCTGYAQMRMSTHRLAVICIPFAHDTHSATHSNSPGPLSRDYTSIWLGDTNLSLFLIFFFCCYTPSKRRNSQGLPG